MRRWCGTTSYRHGGAGDSATVHGTSRGTAEAPAISALGRQRSLPRPGRVAGPPASDESSPLVRRTGTGHHTFHFTQIMSEEHVPEPFFVSSSTNPSDRVFSEYGPIWDDAEWQEWVASEQSGTTSIASAS